jgi:hypothetical protein
MPIVVLRRRTSIPSPTTFETEKAREIACPSLEATFTTIDRRAAE